MDKVVFELQSVDWRNHDAPIPTRELADTVKARQLNPDGAYTWVKPDSEHPLLDSQHSLLYNRSPMVTY